MSEWQTIETAPRDGTEILAWGVMRGDSEKVCSVIARWERMGASWRLDHPLGRYFNGFTATHWMPLPEPPACSTP